MCVFKDILGDVRKAVFPVAACGAGLFVLDSSERSLERGPYHPIESPVFVLRVILGPQRFGYRKPLVSSTAGHYPTAVICTPISTPT